MEPILLSRVYSKGSLRNIDKKPPEIDALVPEHQFADMDGNKAVVTIQHDKVRYIEDEDGNSIVVPVMLRLRGDFKKGDYVILHNLVYEFIGGTKITRHISKRESMTELQMVIEGLVDTIRDTAGVETDEAEEILTVYLQTESFVKNLKAFAR